MNGNPVLTGILFQPGIPVLTGNPVLTGIPVVTGDPASTGNPVSTGITVLTGNSSFNWEMTDTSTPLSVSQFELWIRFLSKNWGSS